MAVYPASVHARFPHEWNAPVKRASARQSVSQSPGLWKSSAWPQTPKKNSDQELTVDEEITRMEGTTEPWLQPRQQKDAFDILRRAKANPTYTY